jgi:hypothetical protein
MERQLADVTTPRGGMTTGAGNARTRRATMLETWLDTAPPKARGSLEVYVRKGPNPAIVSAAHAVRHRRNGAWKSPDRSTGPLALEVARLADCRALICAAPAYEDANYDDASLFKDWLARLVGDRPGLVLDLHGMKDDPSDIVLGTAGGRTPAGLVDHVIAAAAGVGLTAIVAHTGHLGAEGPSTITSWCLRELGVPAVQLELAPRLRDPDEDPERFDRTCRFLAEVTRWT